MNIKDIEIGMRVKLTGKHVASDNYDKIEDFYRDNRTSKSGSTRKLEEQGYGYVMKIVDSNRISISAIFPEEQLNLVWLFSPKDLEPYKSPKEWLTTQLAVFTVRHNSQQYVYINEGLQVWLDKGTIWTNDLNSKYDEYLKWVNSDERFHPNDIMKIDYHGKTVWEREKEEYYTLEEACEQIKANKCKIKHIDCTKWTQVPLTALNDAMRTTGKNMFEILKVKEFEFKK